MQQPGSQVLEEGRRVLEALGDDAVTSRPLLGIEVAPRRCDEGTRTRTRTRGWRSVRRGRKAAVAQWSRNGRAMVVR